MRIISKSRLRAFWAMHPDAEKELIRWHRVVEAASWTNPADVKRTFGVRVDFVRVASGNSAGVFDIHNNKYRLIAAIHYDYPRVFVLRVLTHRQYDQNHWKDEL